METFIRYYVILRERMNRLYAYFIVALLLVPFSFSYSLESYDIIFDMQGKFVKTDIIALFTEPVTEVVKYFSIDIKRIPGSGIDSGVRIPLCFNRFTCCFVKYQPVGKPGNKTNSDSI